jgi:hypothetical protein
MIDIYKETDLLVDELKRANYIKYGEMIKEAKLSGCVATEIFGLILIELKKNDKEINQRDVALIKKIKGIEKEIKKALNLE